MIRGESQITQLPLRSLSPNSWPTGNLIRANDPKSESSRTLVWNQELGDQRPPSPGKTTWESEIKPAKDGAMGRYCGPCYGDNIALAGFRKCWAKPKLGPGYFPTQDVLVSATINQHFLRLNQIECKYIWEGNSFRNHVIQTDGFANHFKECWGILKACG